MVIIIVVFSYAFGFTLLAEATSSLVNFLISPYKALAAINPFDKANRKVQILLNLFLFFSFCSILFFDRFAYFHCFVLVFIRNLNKLYFFKSSYFLIFFFFINNKLIPEGLYPYSFTLL